MVKLLPSVQPIIVFFLKINAIPPIVQKAFISAEDQRFYSHFGVDVFGVFRAVLQNMIRLARNQRVHGASTITHTSGKKLIAQ